MTIFWIGFKSDWCW